MKVYDVNDNLLAEDDKDFEYSENDGYAYKDSRVIKHHEAIEYQPEIRDERPEAAIVLAEYPNGGKDIEYPIIQEEVLEKEAWDEYEDILRFVEYSENEKVNQRIIKLKAELIETDYVVIKIAEGVATKEEYVEVLERRAAARSEINMLETKIEDAK